MDHSLAFYVVFGAAVVLAPMLVDRFLNDGVGRWPRFALGAAAAALTAIILLFLARLLGV